jgi:putative membrane protein insertion efficiency factor
LVDLWSPSARYARNDDAEDGFLKHLLILIARAWQMGPSRILPPSCRYAPSCSAYAISALQKYGAIKGGWLALKRLLRCHPWGGHGYDPVP